MTLQSTRPLQRRRGAVKSAMAGRQLMLTQRRRGLLQLMLTQRRRGLLQRHAMVR